MERDFERRLRKEPGRPTNPETDQRPVTAGISGARAKGAESGQPWSARRMAAARSISSSGPPGAGIGDSWLRRPVSSPASRC